MTTIYLIGVLYLANGQGVSTLQVPMANAATCEHMRGELLASLPRNKEGVRGVFLCTRDIKGEKP